MHALLLLLFALVICVVLVLGLVVALLPVLERGVLAVLFASAGLGKWTLGSGEPEAEEDDDEAGAIEAAGAGGVGWVDEKLVT